jgi:AcrR family transcriptional regulator
MEVREHIIATAARMFTQLGYKRVTMDDISRELSMSKKTLYQYFTDKKDIVSAATRFYLEKEEREFESYGVDAENVIDYLIKLSVFMRKHIAGLNPCVFQDLQKYYPAGWKIFEAFKRDFLYKTIQDALERGKKEGYFRDDIHSDILAIMRMEQVPMAFDQNLFPRHKYDVVEVQFQLLKHFVAGLLTEKGRTLLEQYKQERYDAQNLLF